MADAQTSWLRTTLPLVLLLILPCYANAASFQRYQNIQKDPDYLMKNLQRLPSPDMIKALEYIENLRKQTSNGETSPDYNSYQITPFISQPKESKGHYMSDNLRESLSDDESQWVKAMLEALKQGGKESKGTSKENKPYPLSSDDVFLDGMADDYDDIWPDTPRKHSKMPHVYFEENSRDSPYKRTNEIVEEQYTPQSLATLESVFQELGKMMGPNNQKKERFGEEQKLYADDEDEAYKGNNIAYEDVVGGEDWNPIEEKVESQTQEEVRDSKEEIEKNGEEIDDDVKRSGNLEEGEGKENHNQMSDDISKLMDYYLKKMINSAGNENLRFKQSEDKRAARFFGKTLDPQAIYQLIEISRNLQIPPEDLIEMLRAGEKYENEKEQEAELPEDIDEIPETNLDNSDLFKNKMNSLNSYKKQRLNFLPDNLPDDLNVEDLINLFGVENAGNQKPSYPVNQFSQDNGLPRVSYMPARPKGYLPKATWLNHLERRQMEQETLNEKEEDLADYLAKMLAKYPEVINTGQVKQIPLAVSSEDALPEDDQFEQAIKEHLNQQGSREPDKLSKRVFTTQEGKDDTQNRPYMDEDMLAKVLEYLNQEKSGKGRDHMTKRAMENM